MIYVEMDIIISTVNICMVLLVFLALTITKYGDRAIPLIIITSNSTSIVDNMITGSH